ncbi:MAG: type IV pilus biogenesis protein PilM [Candidatus Dormibacterales bacterium]
MGGNMWCSSIDAPAGSIENGRVVDINAVASALRELVSKTAVLSNRALIAISDALASFRILEFTPSTTAQGIDSAVAGEFLLDPERMATRWVEIQSNGERRFVYAVAWDRAQVRRLIETAKLAGLEPTAVDLKSACTARAVQESACIVIDLSSDLAEILLIDGHLPQVWHSFKLDSSAPDEMASAVAHPVRSVLRFYRRNKGSTFGPRSPILIAGDHAEDQELLGDLSELVGQPVMPLVGPARVPENVRSGTYFTCLGLIMRRN